MTTHNASSVLLSVDDGALRQSHEAAGAYARSGAADRSGALLTFALSCLILVASGAGAYFVASAPSADTLDRLQAETERMRAVHAAEMGALRERLHRLDVDIAATRSSLALAAQKREGASKPGRGGARTSERGATSPDRRPGTAMQTATDSTLDGIDKPDEDPLGGLVEELEPKRKPKRR